MSPMREYITNLLEQGELCERFMCYMAILLVMILVMSDPCVC